MNNANLINQSSLKVEYGTPEDIIEKVCRVLGGIDLDPASSPQWNEMVQADNFFQAPVLVERYKCDDGLPMMDWDHLAGGMHQPWYGRVFMNHPFGQAIKMCEPFCKRKLCQKRGYHIARDQPGNREWINKLVNEYRFGRVDEAINICFASTSEKWFEPLLYFPMCFPFGRIAYIRPDGKHSGATKGSILCYFGERVDVFKKVFEADGWGKVKE